MSNGTAATASSQLFIACLCAQWCGTCNDYAPLFKQLQQDYPLAQFSWIDIEDEADLVDPIEVENFPTILIATDATARFFGTVTPHLETLRRLIDAQMAETGTSKCKDEVHELTQRLLKCKP
jgi:thiol-disulfide isomerase/thioredoxin